MTTLYLTLTDIFNGKLQLGLPKHVKKSIEKNVNYQFICQLEGSQK